MFWELISPFQLMTSPLALLGNFLWVLTWLRPCQLVRVRLQTEEAEGWLAFLTAADSSPWTFLWTQYDLKLRASGRTSWKSAWISRSQNSGVSVLQWHRWRLFTPGSLSLKGTSRSEAWGWSCGFHKNSSPSIHGDSSSFSGVTQRVARSAGFLAV